MIHPGSPGQVVDYLHDRAAEPCGPSAITRVVCTLSFIEQAGLVPEASRFSLDLGVLRVQAQLEGELPLGVARLVRKAPRIFLKVLAAAPTSRGRRT